MRRPYILVPVTVVLLLVLAACGGAKPSPTPEPARPAAATQSAPAASEPTARPTPSPVEPVEATEAPEPTAPPEPTPEAEEDLSLEGRDTGLDQLSAYRVHWRSEWTSTDGDKTEQFRWDWTEEYTADPEALHVTWKASGESDGDAATIEMWQIGDTKYMVTVDKDGKRTCMSFSSSDPEDRMEQGVFSPDLLGGVSGAKYVGTETVNGIRAKHYRYDEKTAGLAAFSRLSGEAWVAVDGGYVVKDVATWEGGAGFFGTSKSSGKGTWTWELTDANGPITITPPENCESAATGLPIMADATEKSTMGDMTIYKTGAKMAQVVDFYKAEMVKAGWALSGDPQVTDEFAMLQFTKGEQGATVTLSVEGDKTNVLISVGQR